MGGPSSNFLASPGRFTVTTNRKKAYKQAFTPLRCLEVQPVRGEGENQAAVNRSNHVSYSFPQLILPEVLLAKRKGKSFQRKEEKVLLLR